MDNIIATRCRRNTLMLSLWSSRPSREQCTDWLKMQGFIESYGQINRSYYFQYDSRPENYCYRNMHLMLKAYDTYFTKDDKDRALRNLEQKRRLELPPEPTQAGHVESASQTQFQTECLELGIWGDNRPSSTRIPTDVGQQAQTSQHTRTPLLMEPTNYGGPAESYYTAPLVAWFTGQGAQPPDYFSQPLALGQRTARGRRRPGAFSQPTTNTSELHIIGSDEEEEESPFTSSTQGHFTQSSSWAHTAAHHRTASPME